MVRNPPSGHEARPRHSATEDAHPAPRAQRRDGAYRGTRVVDEHHRPIGRVTNVLYDEAGVPKWAVVSPGVLRAEHFLPLDRAHLSLEGRLVVPFDKRTVAHSPRAERDHVMSPVVEHALEQYYQLAA